ncbi:MAG TPA: hypothetical protein VLL98_03310 [Rickettsiales bacterium]|nr:hypothetical protein [Rickettsiales bacterium]
MEIDILVGLYGSGKSRILESISDSGIGKISFDDIDIKTRTKEERIEIIYHLFSNFLEISIDYEQFKRQYLEIFSLQNESLINTLCALYSIYTQKNPNEVAKNNLRKQVLIPSILEYFLKSMTASHQHDRTIIDSGAMHFLCMDSNFFNRLSIGANGKIGKQAISMISSQIPEGENVEIVLIGSGTQESLTRLQGFVRDVCGSLELQGKRNNIKFTITNDYSQTKDSNIVICSAGKWPTQREKEAFSLVDPSGRLIQSQVNARMVVDVMTELKTHCPNALVLMVTNQVDMMCYVAREVASNMSIIGLSGAVDSSRLKQKIKEITGLQSDGLMIGFHNASMTPIVRSLKSRTDGRTIFPILSEEVSFAEDTDLQEEFIEVERQKLETILSSTRALGGQISREQRTGLELEQRDTGASILPATAIAQLINGYCFGIPYVESYNAFITEPSVAHHYGIEPKTELSIPIRVNKGRIEQVTEIPLLETEKLAMRRAQVQLAEDLKILKTGSSITL